MDRELCLMRHAKSYWECGWLDDIERPLNERGKRDAPTMGRRLKEDGFSPDLVLSSPASRAYTTARIVTEALGLDPGGILVVEEIYEATTGRLLDIVASVDSRWSRLLLFGHNPTITTTANRLTTAGIDNVPTAGVVRIAASGESWSEAVDGPCRLVDFDYPKKKRS